MKKLLLISPYFPPLGGSGVFRLHRWAKYLPEFGIQPIVVHFDRLPGEPLDESLLKELPETVIRYPVRYIEPSGRGIRACLKKSQTDLGRSISSAGAEQRGSRKLFARVRDSVLIPDLSIAWIFFVAPRIRGIFREHHPDVVLTTYSPGISNILGLWLKRSYQIPWIADFRDPWTDAVRGPKAIFPLSLLNKALERKTLANADYITAYSDGLSEMLWKKISATKLEKFITLGPAVDIAKFDRVSGAETAFDLVYTGALDRDYPCEVFSALSALNQKLVSSGGKNFRVGIAGKIAPECVKFLQSFQSEGWLFLLGYLSHLETISLIKSARALLLLHPEKDWWVPGKVAEYLYSGKPILAVVGQGDIRKILGRFDRVVFAKDDKEEILSVLWGILSMKESERILPEEFTARGQAGKIAGLIESLIKKV